MHQARTTAPPITRAQHRRWLIRGINLPRADPPCQQQHDSPPPCCPAGQLQSSLWPVHVGCPVPAWPAVACGAPPSATCSRSPLRPGPADGARHHQRISHHQSASLMESTAGPHPKFLGNGAGHHAGVNLAGLRSEITPAPSHMTLLGRGHREGRGCRAGVPTYAQRRTTATDRRCVRAAQKSILEYMQLTNYACNQLATTIIVQW